MRRDPSTVVTEFIQGGSLGDDTATSHADINSVENLTTPVLGECDATSNNVNSCMARNHSPDYSKEQREQPTLNTGSWDEESTCSCPLSPCSSSSSSTAEVEVLTGSATKSRSRTSKSVRFDVCAVRSYNQILGDHPLCSVGCPIALGWKVMKEESFSVEDYERIREPLRKKKGAKSPIITRRKRLSHGDEPMAPTPRYMNSQLRLSAQERRDRLQDYSDVQIRKEWSRMQKQSKRGLIKEGLRQFRAVGMQYAGF